MRVTKLLFSLGLILFSFGSVMGQGISVDHVDGLVDGAIPAGATLTFHMRITGDATAHFMLNNGFIFSSPDVQWTDITGEYNPAYTWDAWFDFIKVINFWKTGSIEDTVGIGLLSLFGTGLPASFDGIGFTLTIGPVTGPPGAALTVDSSWYPPSNPWMWDIVGENVAWSGPHTYLMEGGGDPPVITSTPVTSATYGAPYSYDVEATGDPAPTYALTTAPAGMTINPGTGVISWTPDVVGDVPVVVEATNTEGSDTQSFTITVAGIAPTFTSTPITSGTYGVAYSYDADADGYPAATYALTTAPAGMTINPGTGVISWTPDVVGDVPVVVEATNTEGSDTQSFTITVAGIAPTFTSTPITSGTYGVAYSYDADADGYPAATYALTTAPAGMTIDAVTGVISWTPGDVGDFDVVVEANNAYGTDAQSFTITVVGIAPTFTSTPITSGTYGVAYSYDADADGYPAATFALTTAPAGMTIDAVTGVISWTPGDVGDFDVVVDASNAYGSDTQSFTITVDGIPPTFTSTPITSGTYGVAYSYDADADGYPAATFALTTFPAGMTIDAVTGVISWTPGDVGDFDVVVEASNSAGSATQSFTITVVGIAPSFTSTPITSGTYGVAYSYDADADGYPAVTFALTTFPAGMTIDAVTGVISWTPGDVGDFDVVVEANNAYGTDAQSFTITVVGIAPSFTSTPITSGTYGVAYSYDADADGYPAATYALTTFPVGMTIDAITGVISWTPGDVGDFDVVVEASNAYGSDAQSFTITVDGIPPTFTSTPITSGTYGVAYSYDADADGYPAATYALTTFPAGMTIDAVTGVISWTPGDVGDFDVVVEASNSAGSAPQSFTITVVGIAPSFTSTPITSGTYGVAYSYDADADGYPAVTFALTTAPAGMTINPVTGVISWTPGDVGDFDVVVEALNAYGTDTQAFTIAVAGIAPTFTSTPITSGTYGVAYSYDADADGYPAATYSLTTAPVGMTIDAVSGLISWTPGDVGDYDVVVEATNSAGSDVQSFTITVDGIAPTFTSTPITSGTYDVAYSYDADADGYPAPTFALTTAPAGMTIDAVSGLISWTPGDVGDFDVVVEASNSAGSATQSFTITVVGIAPAFTTSPQLGGVVGELYAYDADADGYPAATYALTTFPAGMTIDAVTGLVQWTPAAEGDFDVTIEASNGFGTAIQSFTITVVAGPEAPVITSTPVTSVTVFDAYAYDVQATGNPAPTFALTTAPAGMTIDAASGLIQWSPTAVGDYDVTVVATNAVDPDAVQSFTITVLGIAPTFTSTPVTSGTYGVAYSYDADADGTPAPTFALTTFPAGMTIDAVSGVISWTPGDVGDFDVVVEASNSAGSATQSFTITVDGIAPTFTSTPPLGGVAGELYSYDADADGYPAPTYALTTAPAGMTVNATTGLVEWTPAAAGTYDVVLVAFNGYTPDATQSFSIEVVDGPEAPVITTTPVTSVTVNDAYSYDVDATGNPAPTFALTTAPAGMTIDAASGLIQWTPTAVGDFDVTVVATNSVDPDAVQSFTITVLGIAPTFTSTPVTSGTCGVPYTYDVDSDGIPAPTFSLTTFPAGMTIDAVTGVISWTPDGMGDYPVTVEATNAFGSDVQSFAITVLGVIPTFTSTAPLGGVVDELYTYDADADGCPDPTFALTTAPTGMTIDAVSGLVQWTPTAAGDFDIVIAATNGAGSVSQSFTISVASGPEAPGITSTPVTDGTVGVLYSYDVEATGNPAPTFALTVFPTGMTINAATGLIQWTPGAVGDFAVTVVASNGVGDDATQSYTITVVEAPVAPVITSAPVTEGQVGVAYAYDVDATGNPTPTFALTVAPAGMTIDAVSGVIDWTPTVAANFNVTVTASNGVDPDADQSFVIAVVPAGVAPTITTTPVTNGIVGQLYYYNVDASGYPAPTYNLAEAPAGMTIDAITGEVRWTPDTPGDFPVTVEAVNDYGTDAQEFSINVPSAPYTYCTPQPTVLKAEDRILYVHIVNENPDNVNFNSIRVQRKIPPYTEVTVENGEIITDAFIMRFLGSSGFRPITNNFEDTYTVDYDYIDGTPATQLIGDFALIVLPGDVTFDGQVTIDDLIFLAEFFFNDGPVCDFDGTRLPEFMDIDKDGSVDPRDIVTLRNILSM